LPSRHAGLFNMRKLIVSTFVTLDGVMQAPDGPEEDPTGGFTYGGWTGNYWDAMMGQVMGGYMAKPFDLLLGRKTYEIFAAHWPYIKDDPAADKLNSARKYVVSGTLDEVNWNNSALVKGNVVEAIRKLKEQKGPEIQVHGSSNLIQTLLKHDLIDEFRLWIFPVTIGKGKRLFGEGTQPAGLKLIDSKPSTTGVIIATYEPAEKLKTGSFALDNPSVAELKDANDLPMRAERRKNNRSKIMATIKQKITPNLWFDRQAEEAAKFYVSIFKNSRLGRIVQASKAGFEIHGLPEGTVMTIEFEIEGQKFIAINGGPLFKFTSTVSFLVACNTKEEVDEIWEKLSEGGTALMELGEYPFSEKYGWIEDRYGLSWQVMFMGDRRMEQKITPTLMFVGEQFGKAEEAINLYTSVFNNAEIGDILRYGKGEEPDREGTIKHAAFTLENQGFAAMDSARNHNFTFNEAISFMVECGTQEEIDDYWEKIISDGGQESVCGWLKDKFGVSWQVAPTVLGEMLRDHDKKKVERVTNAFLKMKKFDIGELKKAFEGQ
jgi:predicted 3-demethylubiquinone-9 3-methyltransferase (glyoxalase superfamily)/dihydrofolate reductase